MATRSLLGGIVAVAGVLGWGCSGEVSIAPPGEDLGQAVAPVYIGDDGHAKLDGQQHPQVVKIRVLHPTQSAQSCTASLVASNVLLTAAHCFIPGFNSVAVTEPMPGDENPPVDAAFARLNTTSPQVLLFPKYKYECFGTDSALLVYPPSHAVPRRVLRPMKVARLGSEPECPDWNDFCMGLIGLGRNDSNCLDDSIVGTHGRRTQLWMEDGLGKDDCDYNQVEFDFDDSKICHGDSGGPVIYHTTGQIVANAGGYDGDDLVGPALWNAQGSVRQWLRANGLDRDGDGIEAADDNCDTVANPIKEGKLTQEDWDNDGVGDACDPCPYIPNEWEHDTDGDGVVDCLDRCPNDPPDLSVPACASGQDTIGDSDCDGKCDSVDLCPFNAGGALDANANELAEDVHLKHLPVSARRFPDACEPVPVPNATPAASEVVEDYSSTSHSFLETYIYRRIKDKLVVEPQPSRKAKDKKSGPSSIVPTGAIDTDVRFCQTNWDGYGSQCTHESYIDDNLRYPGLTAEQELSSMPYRRIKARLVNGPIRPRGWVFPFVYNGATRTLRWDYEADGAFWTNPANFDPPLVLPPPQSDIFDLTHPGPYSGLEGALWLHGRTKVGHWGNNIGTGTHGDSSVMGSEKLSNRYFHLRPEWVEWWMVDSPLIEVPEKPLWFTLPDPPSWRMRIDNLVRPTELMVPVAQGEVGLINPDGRVQIISDQVGPGLRAALGDSSLSWAPSTEAAVNVTRDEALPAAVALDQYGTRAVAAAKLTREPNGPTRFDLYSETPRDSEPSAPRLLSEPPQSTSAPADPDDWVGPVMPPAKDFHTIYSRVQGMILRVGGQDLTTNAPVGVLWRASLDAEGWQRVPVSRAFGKVLAATMTYVDGHVYVIDEVEDGWLRTRRLLRVEHVGGSVEVLAAWPSLGVFDRYWLTLDQSGDLLLAGSSHLLHIHKLYRLSVKAAGPVLSGFLLGQGELMAPVLADEHGLVFYRRSLGGAMRPQRRAATYLPCSTSWTTLKDLFR